MSGLMARLGGRSRNNGASALIQIAREVVGRRRSVQGALTEIRHPAVLDALADEDFRSLDATIAERASSDHEFALVLARLAHAAARAKSFDRQVVDAALRLDALLPADDPNREREKLLRDAYTSAQKASYVRGGRLALGRLGRRAVEAGDLDRARVLLQQQLDLGPDTGDSAAEVDSAIVLGDIVRRDGDVGAAQALYRRAGVASQRLEHHRGLAEALIRQVELMPEDASLDAVAALQRQALDAAERTGDAQLESRIILALADTLSASGRHDEAADQLAEGLAIARALGDLSLEARCESGLAVAERRRGRLREAAEHERRMLTLEERLGNRPAAAAWAAQLASTELALHDPEGAVDAFERARDLAQALGDGALEQRAEGGLGVAYTLLRRPSEALAHLMRALDLARAAGDERRQARWLASIGEALWTFGQVEASGQATQQAVDVARRIGDAELEAGMLALLGQVHAARREPIRARDCYTRALELHRALGQTGEQVTTLAALAQLAAETGQPVQAMTMLEQALQIATAAGDRAGAARLYGRLGRLAQRRGDAGVALDALGRALELAEAVDQPALLNQALQHLATAQDLAGDGRAADTYRRAVTVAQHLGDAHGEAVMRLNLGALLSVHQSNGHVDEGIAHLQEAAALAADLPRDDRALRERIADTLASVVAEPELEFEPEYLPSDSWDDEPGQDLDGGEAGEAEPAQGAARWSQPERRREASGGSALRAWRAGIDRGEGARGRRRETDAWAEDELHGETTLPPQ
ncbi:MAG: hypothetical protein AVDCRST_MAG49-1310 [uncultured Thermomicrobiales bacterium]|uniref:MalT-like TPR region domain-containing protein n=1 Tax=uncultured Thermomicrobiales bacterium TaxID=1645740 RepID=A0A6J4UAZ5_9BACT|nr:MAG: hypothetical protein AVDCRST_MAG49-1310 [uncultured Thermomicrobiales bacterium]